MMVKERGYIDAIGITEETSYTKPIFYVRAYFNIKNLHLFLEMIDEFTSQSNQTAALYQELKG